MKVFKDLLLRVGIKKICKFYLVFILENIIISSSVILVLYYEFWGLGIGDWGLGIGPNPQSPIPNPQSPTYKKYFL